MPICQARGHPLSAVLHAVIALAALITLTTWSTWSTKSYAADLWDIYQLALTNDPQYQAAVLDHETRQINLPLAKSAFKPSLTANSQLGSQVSDSSGASKTSHDHSINLNLNLPLYDKTKRVAITQSKHRVDISSLRLHDAKQRLMLRVANRYFNLLGAQDARQVAHLEKIAIRRQMDLANKRLQAGLGTRIDLYDASARFKLAEANQIQAQNQINNDIALLKQIIGTTPEALSILNDSAPLILPDPNDVDVWINQSIEDNVALNIEILNLQIALQEIDKQRVSRSPTLSFDANHRFSDSGATSANNPSRPEETNTTSASLVMRFPFYLGGAISLSSQQARLEYNRTERLLEQARRLASVETTSAFLAVASGVSRIEALLDATTAGESALAAKEQGFSAGLTTNIDVLDAQRDLSRSKTDYLRARYNYIIAVLELERSAGQLDEQDIKRVNSWLDVATQ